MSDTTTACAICRWHQRVIEREVRRNQKRMDAGKPIDLAVIDRAKADRDLCAAAGRPAPGRIGATR
jgi:hypothetical protein